MPRRARLDYPGGVFHVISRFAHDEWWFDRKGARSAYLEQIARRADKTDARVLAYCLMSNHLHLVVVQGEQPLSSLFKAVHTGFASWVRRSSRRKGPIGHVFAGRPKMLLVEEDPYLDELVRYVHNNPVRAEVVERAQESAWSSHRAYIGLDAKPEWLHAGYVLGRFAKRARTAARRFDAFVDDGRLSPRDPVLSGDTASAVAQEARDAAGDAHRLSDGILGSDEFQREVMNSARVVEAALSKRGEHIRRGRRGRPELRDLVDQVMSILEIDPWELDARPRSRRCAHAKRLVLWVWVRELDGRQSDVAREFGLSTSAVAQQLARCTSEMDRYEREASAVLARLPQVAKSREQVRVRYFVDVDED